MTLRMDVSDTSFGKTIELFWVNSTADGIVTAELSNWNGKGIKTPRTEIMLCQREDVCEPGVYFLLCQEDDGTDSVYIGEAENIKDNQYQIIQGEAKSSKQQCFGSASTW